MQGLTFTLSKYWSVLSVCHFYLLGLSGLNFFFGSSFFFVKLFFGKIQQNETGKSGDFLFLKNPLMEMKIWIQMDVNILKQEEADRP